MKFLLQILTSCYIPGKLELIKLLHSESAAIECQLRFVISYRILGARNGSNEILDDIIPLN